MNILLIGSSPAHPSSSSRLLQYIGERLESLQLPYQHIQVRELPAQALLLAQHTDPAIQQALAAVAAADAIVLATPVYNASFAGLLKTFLDLLPQTGLTGKVVLPIATGGSLAHMLALDYALRPVLQALEARHVLSSIFVTSADAQWLPDSGLILSPAIAQRVQAGVKALTSEYLSRTVPRPERDLEVISTIESSV